MRKRILYTTQCCFVAALCFLSYSYCKAQTNLVPNPSFEQYTICPDGVYHQHPDYWYQPDKGGGGIGMLVEYTMVLIMCHIQAMVFSMLEPESHL